MKKMDKDLKKYENCLQEIENFFAQVPIIPNNLPIIDKMIRNSAFYARIIPSEISKSNAEEIFTEEEILSQAREILSVLDKDFVSKFDELVSNHQIGIFKDKTLNTGYHYLNGKKVILIQQQGGYENVIDVVHEFIHLYHYKKDNDLCSLLTEFFAIYFEMYATEYLNQKKGVPLETLNYQNRIINDKTHIINSFSLINGYYLYHKCKSFNIEEYEKIFPGFNQDNFDTLYDYNMDLFENIIQTHPGKEKGIGEFTTRYIMYALALILATYSLHFKTKDDVIKLYKELYNKENEDLDLNTLLKKYGFEITEENIEKTGQFLVEYTLKVEESAKKRKI